MRLTLDEAAAKAGCAKSYLSALENGHRSPPSETVCRRIEGALSFDAGELVRLAHAERMPAEVRRDIESLQARERSARTLARLLTNQAASGGSLDEMFRSGKLRSLIDRLDPSHDAAESIASALPSEIPLINNVAAGYPADFTDLDYPARVAD
ncbi:MAG: helix-turn-helix transcriptional regulator, partial [Planctomycetota bacterium]